ncbi:acyl carrier protein [Aureivirga marina]|uniref:acyl carrier protein n=1 Tax=Aureivirga marina TaxID=1182451 RepID=UPI0018C9D949|nr:acyl carrier protein [Aureivirga marina]
MEEFLEKISEILEVESVNLSDNLEDFDEWDSLTSLSLIAMIDSDYNISVTNDDIREFKTIEDVCNFVKIS